MKTCYKCKISKEYAEFYPEKGNASGFSSYCKPCNKDYLQARRADKESKKKDSQKKHEWYKRNCNRVKENMQIWVESNRGKSNKVKAKYRASKLQRTPKWLTVIDFERIQNEYRLAEILTRLHNKPWHVDHIIPLQGKLVSGLHVPNNLQVLIGSKNCSKQNNFVLG